MRRFSADDDTRHDLLRTGIYRCKDSASREECQIYLDTSEAGSLQNAVENRKQDRFIENSGSKKALPSILQMVQITVTHKVFVPLCQIGLSVCQHIEPVRHVGYMAIHVIGKQDAFISFFRPNQSFQSYNMQWRDL